MLKENREFFATFGIILSWLAPLVVFFLFLGVPTVRDLLTAFAFVIAVYNTVQLYRWGNRRKSSVMDKPITQPRVIDSRTRIQYFLDSLSDMELDELNQQLQQRLIAREASSDYDV